MPDKTNPAGAGFVLKQDRGLSHLYLFSLHTFLTASGHVGNSLAFFQAFETVALDGFKVNEEIIAAVSRGNEAEAFLIVEPFDGASFAICHGVSLKSIRSAVPECS